MAQVANLKDHELGGLARFLGHNVRTHRKYYRLQDAAFQTALLSKLLLSVESGKLVHGQSPEDIECKQLIKLAFIQYAKTSLRNLKTGVIG